MSCRATVTIADLNEKVGTEFVAALKARGLQYVCWSHPEASLTQYRLKYISTDVTDWQSQVNAFKSAIACSDRKSIDIVVAAAGVGGRQFIEPEEEPPSLDKDPPLPPSACLNFDVNAKGVYFTSKLAQHYFALLPLSQTRAMPEFRKCLVVISSLAGYLELNAADYTASKWAIRGLFRSTRSKMEDLGYRINLIAPWIMDTPMSKGLADMCRKNGFPVGDANDVTSAVIRVVTDDSICGRSNRPRSFPQDC